MRANPTDQRVGLGIEQFGVVERDMRRRCGHRRIDIDLERREALALNQVGENADDFLRAADGKSRDDQVAVGGAGALDGVDDFVLGLGHGAVRAVAVGRFDEQQVGLGDDFFGVAQHRSIVHSEVARKDQFARAASVDDVDFEPRRPQDVAGVVEADLDCRRRVDRRTVGDRAQQLQRRLRLRHRVQRRRNGAFAGAAPALMAQLPLDVFLLDVRTVRQQHLKQVDGRRSGIDRSAEAEHREPRQQAGMVDVRVGQQNEVDLARVETEVERMQVLAARFRPALEHPAVDQEADVAHFDQST